MVPVIGKRILDIAVLYLTGECRRVDVTKYPVPKHELAKAMGFE